MAIQNKERTIQRLEDLAQFKSFAKLIFNQHVYSVYSKPTEENKQAKRALLIKDDDNHPIITSKILLFFLALQKLEQTVEEKLLINKVVSDEKDPNMITATVKLNPSKKYHEGKSVGTRDIKIPHVDESKLAEFGSGVIYKHGNTKVIYTFSDKKQIKGNFFTKEDGFEFIESCLKIVKKDKILGKPSEHCYVAEMSKTTEKGILHGLSSRATALHLSDKKGKMYTMFL